MSVTESESSEMSLGDALTYGQQLLSSNELDNAEDLYRQLFRAVPEHAEVTHMLGLVLLKKNRAEEASVLIEKSLQLNPAYLDANVNLGNTYLKLQFIERAEDQFRSALHIDPENTQALFGLASLLKNSQKTDEAVSCFKKILSLDPGHRAANTNLALLLVQEGREDEAQLSIRSWLKIEPDNESAKMLHASISGENVPDRAPDDYVRNMFDSSAADFDSHLEALDYRAPELADSVLKKLYPSSAALSVLDAGCGTGLCGPFLKRVSGQLTGVDLSSKMIQLAEHRHCYDSLEVAELTDYLGRSPEQFDLIVCMDTFCYFGPLDQVISLTASTLKNGGRLIFTLEELNSSSQNYSLHRGQRYNHTFEYTKRIMTDCGFNIDSMGREVLRKEGKDPVNGLLVVATK